MPSRFSCLLLIAAIAIAPQAAIAVVDAPKVLVTVAPLKPYIDAILKGAGESTSLLRPGQNPHTTVLSPSQAAALAEADIIVIPSRAMSPMLSRILDKKKQQGAQVIELLALPGADPLPYPADNPWLASRKDAARRDAGTTHVRDDDEDHEAPAPEKKESAQDPHIWLDPLRMAAIAEPLAVAMSASITPFRTTLVFNAQQEARHLREEVSPAIANLLKTRPPRQDFGNKPLVPFITYHASYQYFLARYRIAGPGFVTQVPVEYAGARSLHDALAGAEAIRLRCLISENDSGLVRTIANQSGAEIVTLDPEAGYAESEISGFAPWAKNDYDRLLYKTAKSFAGCL